MAGRDKQLIARFVTAYNSETASSFRITSWPDEEDRSGKAIDAIAEDGRSRIAIEHTLLQPFEKEREDSAVFLRTMDQLDQSPDLVVPGFDITLTFYVGAVPRGVDWSQVAPAVKQWCQGVSLSLPEGRSSHLTPGLPFDLRVTATKTALGGTSGHFFVSRWMPELPLETTVRQALNTKVVKLASAVADYRLLLLEKNVPIRGDGEIGETIDSAAHEYPGLAMIHQVWTADTCAWDTEDYVAFHLIWPLQAALDRLLKRQQGG